MSHCSLEKIWRCLRVERKDLAQNLLKSSKNYDKELYEKLLLLNKIDGFLMEEEVEETISSKQEILMLNSDHLDLLNQLSDIEKQRNVSDSNSDLDDNDSQF